MIRLLRAVWLAASEPHRPATPWRRRGAAVFAAVLLTRLALCFLVLPRSLAENPRDGYGLLAASLVADGRLSFSPDAPPTLFRPPGYPAALALSYLLVGDKTVALLLLNCLAAALTCTLVDRIAGLVLGRTVAFPWVAVLALFPPSVYYGAGAFSDTLYTCTVALYLLSVFTLLERGDVRSGVWCGATLALSALTRPLLLPFPVVLLAYAWLRKRACAKAVLVSALVALALISPWTVRNYRLSGRLIPVTTGAGFTSLTGFFMPWGSAGAKMIKKAHREAIREALGVVGEEAETVWQGLHTAGHWDIRPEADAVYGKAAWELVRGQPWRLVKKFVTNGVLFWYVASTPRMSVANGCLNLVLLALALPSLLRAAPPVRGHLELFVLFQVSFMSAYALVLVAAPRYSLPVQMALAPLAAATLADGWAALRARKKARGH